MEPIVLLPIVGGILLYFVIKVVVRIPGQSLNRKFVKLGNFTNLNKQDFINAVGPCQAISNHTSGQQLCQWHATGYRMAILFDANGKFIKIQSEIKS